MHTRMLKVPFFSNHIKNMRNSWGLINSDRKCGQFCMLFMQYHQINMKKATVQNIRF